MDRVLTQFDEVQSVPTATPGAEAWTAREPGGGRRVLIKRLDGDSVRTRATQALALHHPQIVPTRRWMRDEDRFYVVRDWVAGRNLRQALAPRGQRAFDRLHARLLPLLDTLDYAHSAGLPHGGLTPENVLVPEDHPNFALLCDFATIENPNGTHAKYVPRALLTPDGQPTPRADFYALCELYKEFLPSRSADDEAGAAARERLLRNLTETQQTAGTADELRYKLEAVAKMADLLGFSAEALELAAAPVTRLGPRLVCAVSPPTATLPPGGGTTLMLSLDNEGDAPLHVESVKADVVWLNLPNGFTPVVLDPGTGGDLLWNLSGARLEAGVYSAGITIRSNHGLPSAAPLPGADWPEQTVSIPVLVKGSAVEGTYGGPIPLAERLLHPDDPAPPAFRERLADGDENPGIACVQEPDPGLVRYGQKGVLHIGVRNIGPQRLRLDKVTTRPSWLSYPGEFQPLWIEPGATQYLGFSVAAAGLMGGDYTAEVKFVVSLSQQTLLSPKMVWREMRCEVRVRVVRGGEDALPGGLARAGCIPATLALVSSFGLLAFWLRR